MITRLTKPRLALAIVAAVALVPTAAFAIHVFDDVDDGRFFAEAVEWAFSNEITTGTSDTTFEPDRGVTRGESVTFLKRYHDKVVLPALPERYHAIVDGTGAAQPGTSPGVLVTKGGPGSFDVELPADDVRGCVWQATVVLPPPEELVLVTPIPPAGEITLGLDFDFPPGPAIGPAPDIDSIMVRTWTSSGAGADLPFHLTVEC